MRLTAKRVIAAAAAAALTIGLAACSQGGSSSGSEIAVSGEKYDGPAVSLQFWNPFTGPDGAHFQTMVDDFNKKNPKIKVTMTTMAADDLYSKLPVAVKSSNGPDVAVIHLSHVATVAAGGTLLGLDKIVKSLGFQEADFAPAVWKGGVYNGTRYSVPLDMHMLGLFYNKTVLAKAGLDPNKPPQTAQEYSDALAALRKAGIQGQWIDSYGFMRTYFISLLHQFGGQEYNAAGDKALWNSDAGVKALTWLQNLIKNGDSPQNVGADKYWDAFKNNQTAFVWGGIWALGDADLAKIDWGVAPLPTIGGTAAVWSDSHQFVATSQIKGDANKTAAAAYFISQISANSIEWAKANTVPARASVRESSEFKAIPKVGVFASQLPDLVLPTALPGLNAVDTVLTDEMNKVLLLQKEPKAALDDAVAQADQILAENKAKYGY